MTLIAKISKALEEIFDTGDNTKVIEAKNIDNTPFKYEKPKLKIAYTVYPDELHPVCSKQLDLKI